LVEYLDWGETAKGNVSKTIYEYNLEARHFRGFWFLGCGLYLGQDVGFSGRKL